MWAIDVHYSHILGRGVFRPLHDKDLDARLSCSSDFLTESAARAAFLGDDGLGLQSLNQYVGFFLLKIY